VYSPINKCSFIAYFPCSSSFLYEFLFFLIPIRGGFFRNLFFHGLPTVPFYFPFPPTNKVIFTSFQYLSAFPVRSVVPTILPSGSFSSPLLIEHLELLYPGFLLLVPRTALLFFPIASMWSFLFRSLHFPRATPFHDLIPGLSLKTDLSPVLWP